MPSSRPPRIGNEGLPVRALPTPAQSNRTAIHVLVVDSDPRTAQRYRDWLAEDPEGRFQLSLATDGASALTQAAEMRPDAVLLCDCLPDTSGPILVRDLYAQMAPALPTVVLVESVTGPARPDEGYGVDHVFERLSVADISAVSVRLSLLHGVRHTEQQYEVQRARTARDSFVYTAAHDLKSPLRQIISYGEILQTALKDRPDELRYLTHVRRAGERMNNLVDDLLTYASTDRPLTVLGEVDLGSVIADVLTGLQDEIAQCGALVEVGPVPHVLGDRAALRHLCYGLLSNALKFRGEAPPRIQVMASELQSQVVLAVKDNGIGIAPRDRERIFAPFVRLGAASNYAGSGMGLATCRRVAESLGGRIWLESTQGIGTTFFASLPGMPHGVKRGPSSGWEVRPCLLLIDDQESELSLAKELLGTRYELLSACNRAEALALLADRHVDAVLCDHALGGLEGTVLLQEIQALHPAVTRMLTSAHAPPDLRKYITSGAVHYFFPKMASRKQIDAALARAPGPGARASAAPPERSDIKPPVPAASRNPDGTHRGHSGSENGCA